MIYDDAEGMLQDQGLEVVVIPYLPSPPSRPGRKGLRSPVPPSEVASGTLARLGVVQSQDQNQSQSQSPATEESKRCDDRATPPSPPEQLEKVTPRTEAAMAEAAGQSCPGEHSSPPPLPPLDASSGKTRVGAAIDSTTAEGSSGQSAAVRSASAAGPPSGARRGRKGPPRSRSSLKSSKPSASAQPAAANNSRKGYRKDSKKMGMYQMAKMGYQELCNAIIRPPRSNYSLETLGPEEFTFCGENFVRKDFGVVNERGLLIECSIWKKAREEDEDEDILGGSMEEGGVRLHNGGHGEENGEGHRHRQITLNVDDWDENKERGQMFLHIPESLEDESLSSSGFDESCSRLDDIIDEACGEDSHDEPHRESSPTNPIEHSRHQPSDTKAHYYYQGTARTRKRHRDPVVIYLHGNSSGRVEVIPQLGHLLSLGVAVVAFDFTGSGRSEGDFVSLGFFEREDLQTVVHHLRASGDVSTIALWGRSMGAATAIMYGSRDPTISCMILDSSFTDLTQLAEEMVERGKEQGVNVPNFVVSVALRMIKSSVKSQAGFSIRHISPISHVERCHIPAMFIAGEHDAFINKRHSEILHAKYAGDKNLVVVDGNHNSPRPRFLLQSACLFLQSCMQLSPSAELIVPMGTNLFAPPWSSQGFFSTMGLNQALQKARIEALSLNSEERNWLPLNDTSQQQLLRQRSQPPGSRTVSNNENTAKQGRDPPPGLPFNRSVRNRSDTVATSPTSAEIMAATAPPDMSERQKEIQSSLFKMLGQHE